MVLVFGDILNIILLYMEHKQNSYNSVYMIIPVAD